MPPVVLIALPFIGLAYCIVCCVAAGKIGERKSPANSIAFYLLGLFLGLIGVLLAMMIPGGPAPEGWYRDPWKKNDARWWDGFRWTDEVSEFADAGTD